MLRKLYRWLFGGCDHEWTIIHKVEMRETWGSAVLDKYLIYHLQCKKCGNMKKKSMK